MLNLAQIEQQVKQEAPAIEPNTLNLAGRSIAYKQLKSLGWQSTRQTHPVHKTSTLQLDRATICLDVSQNRAWFVEIDGTEHHLTGGVTDITEQVAEMLDNGDQPSDLDNTVADIKAELGNLNGRLERAKALVEQGVTEFPKYDTRMELATMQRFCNCPDRSPRVWFGKACKHNLAQYIAYLLEVQAETTAYRKLDDLVDGAKAYGGFPGDGGKVPADYDGELPAETRRLIEQEEKRRRDTALPANVGQRERIEDYLGYDDDTPSETNAQRIIREAQEGNERGQQSLDFALGYQGGRGPFARPIALNRNR